MPAFTANADNTDTAAPRDESQALRAVDSACARIAPSWPLDQSIAVNPWWGWRDQAVEDAAAKLACWSGARLLMPRAWFGAQFHAGRFRAEHLQRAIDRAGASCSVQQLIALMHAPEPAPPRRSLMTDLADAARDVQHHMAWVDFVTHHLSQACASYFDDGQAQWQPVRDGGLYAAWRRHMAEDLSPRLLMGLPGFRTRARQLPSDARALITQAASALGIAGPQMAPYFTSLLLSINGWAAWCAYLHWQAGLAGRSDDHIVELLAMRLAWEWLLHDCGGDALHTRWQQAMQDWPLVDAAAHAQQAQDWLLQDALELAYQDRLCDGLRHTPRKACDTPPTVQAVFCIDVRSEVFRRALEAQSAAVQTLGFAGFFGLFIDYQPLASATARPHLPGFFAPKWRVTDTHAPQALALQRTARLQFFGHWKQFKSAPVSGFSFVEAAGLGYAWKLASNSLGRSRPVPHPDSAGLGPRENALRKPRLHGPAAGGALTSEQGANTAAAMLRAMSLTHGFAPLVLLAGHGAQTVNNPFAAAYDCGACCGQSGEVNARAAAALLNEPQVRAGLAARGIDVPEGTHFIAGLHDTTTDELRLFDLDEVPASHHAALAELQGWLDAAGQRARAERAPALHVAAPDDNARLRALRTRARDWAQLRPEWGLADCAAFIVAPRGRSRHLDLAGRAFLHDYAWREDTDFATLDLIMSAPMIVTHWIAMQYTASTVDNRCYGSGNKLLHNVVGGHIGVFEGNGGDLRIGLPLQALHDGRRWMHTPQRLSVFIEAPTAAMDAVIARHTMLQQLLANRWLHLFQIDDAAAAVRAWRGTGTWREASTSPARQDAFARRAA